MKFKDIDEKLASKYFLAVLLLVKIAGVAFATLVFARFTPLVDSELYLKGFYTGEQASRTALIQ